MEDVLTMLTGSVGGISLISIPALIDTIVSGTLPHHVAPQLWRVIFERGKATMPIAAATAAACYGTLARSRYASQRPWIPFALSSVTTIAIVPFTVIAMSGTNGSLIQLSAGQNVRDLSVEGILALLKTWSRLNLTRSLLPLVGALTSAWYLRY
jgi:hypothetical protein